MTDETRDDRQRLHRDPKKVDGLQPEKRPDHRPARTTDERSAEGAKPYTGEIEDYADDSVRSPDDAVEREDARIPPRR